ncbi:hypothetical protein JKF63_04867 [Porcisia hertigi]|uniref:Helicase ATP-binding domain-containing protein n=1 Tax=Porcisia hertigi TaxID=2761500 RepID=A0A836IUX9_9TRYP|nr:hypothetical protein JKF63_04867 [Porcisia hertigi]
MLTRRQARLLGLTSGENGGVSDSRVTSLPQSVTGVVAGDVSRDLGHSVFAESWERLDGQDGRQIFTMRPSATGTSSSSAPAPARGYRTNQGLQCSASSITHTRHANGDNRGSGSAGGSGCPARRGPRQAEILLSKAQESTNYWGAASTTAGPSFRLANDPASQWNTRCTSFTKSAVTAKRDTGASSIVMTGASWPGRAARLTAAQLRTRWRGVTRNCSCIQVSIRTTPSDSGVPHSSTRGMCTARTTGLPTAAHPASPSSHVVCGLQGQGGAARYTVDSTEEVQHATRTTASPDVPPHRSLSLFTSPFYADVASPTLLASAEAMNAAEAAAGALSIMRHIPTPRTTTTALALRRRKERMHAQRQRRLCHEVHYQVSIKANRARMRLLFGLSDTDNSAVTTRPPGDLAQDHSVAALTSLEAAPGEGAYLQSLDSRKSDEETRVLRVIAAIDGALRRQLARAYTHTSKQVFPSTSSSIDEHVHAATTAADEHSENVFAAHRPALLEAAIADATRSVEAFTDQLLSYQQEGVRWLLRLNVVEHVNGILADDTGLGKTAQTIVYLSCYKDLVEEMVQRPLEELQQRQVCLCQQTLGLKMGAAAMGGSAVVREVDGVEVVDLPPWLTWYAEVATGKQKNLRESEPHQQRSGSAVKSSAINFPRGDTVTPGRPLAAMAERAPLAATPEPTTAAARVCSGFLKVVKQVKQWLWHLEEGIGEGDVETAGGEGTGGAPYSPFAGHKRRMGESEDDHDENVEVHTLAVTAAPPVKRRRGRPPKRLSSLTPTGATAAGPAVGPPAPIEVCSVDLEGMVASHTHLPTVSLPVNRQLERALRTFRPVLIIAPLCTLSHWSGEFQRFSRRHAAAAGSLCPDSSDAAERFTVYVLNGSPAERESRMREFFAHVERLTQQSPTRDGASCGLLFTLAGGPAAKPATPVLIIPLDMLAKPLSGALRLIRRVRWHVVVIDEAQRVKCTSSALFKQVCELRCVSRLVLTGTPLQNNVTELFSLLRFLAPHALVSSELLEQLDSALLAASRSSALEDREPHILLCRRIHRLLMPFILRRERGILKAALPPIRDFAVLCPLLPLQRARLGEVERRHQAEILSSNSHIQCRKILLHPCTTQSFFYVDEEVVRTSGKLLVLDFMMRFLKRTHHKFLVFCRWTLMLDVVETLCGMRGIPYVRLDDRTPVEQWEANIRSFNRSMASPKNTAGESGDGSAVVKGGASTSQLRLRSCRRASTNPFDESSPEVDGEGNEGGHLPLPAAPPCCFLISNGAGGARLDLQAADTVFLLDVDHNSQRDAQALSWVYRVGQKKEVRVFRLVIDHPIEHGIVSIHKAKGKLGRAVAQAGLCDLHSSVHEREAALQSLFRAGALSHLNQQWASAAAPSTDDSQVDGDEVGGASAVSTPMPSFPCMSVLQCASRVEASAASGVRETSGALPSPSPAPKPAIESTLGEGVKSEVGDGESVGLVHPDHTRVFETLSGDADRQRAPLPLPSPTPSSSSFSSPLSISADAARSAESTNSPATFIAPRRRRSRRHLHISFKLDMDGSEEGDSRAHSYDSAAASSVEGATAPLLFAATPPHPSMRAVERDAAKSAAAADAEARVLAPAEHLLAMRERLEEVLPRHDGEWRVLDDMFRSVEGSLGSASG